MSLIINHIGYDGSYVKTEVENIRYDDTIDTIKEKIIVSNPNLEVSIDSIYLFTKIEKNISDEKVFKELTKSRGKFNTLDTKDINVLKQNCGVPNVNKKKFNYEDFKREFGDKCKKYNHPLGHSIFYKNDYAFVTNPYHLIIKGSNRYSEKELTWDTFLFNQDNNKNLIKYSGKKLLFEYLNPEKDNEIFYCTAKEIGRMIFEENLYQIERPTDFYKYILQIYFPKLFYIKKYYTYEHDDKITNKNALIEDILDKWKKNHEKIDHFYKYFKNEKNEKKRKEGLITSINLTIHMIKNVKIPMDLIFKILNTLEGMPMVKFNPGKRRENIFRLWTNDYLSKNGLKLPYLYVNDDNRQYKIKNIDKTLALKKSVGIYIIFEEKEMYCELYPDGSINIKIEKIEEEKEKLETFIKNQINEYILVPINDFLKKSGFEYALFEKLTDDNIEIKNIKYRYVFPGFLKREKFTTEKFAPAINQIYQTNKTNFKTKGKIDFRYIKVSSYKKSTALASYIINYMNEYGQGVEVDKDLAKLLVDNKLVDDKEEAMEEIRKSKENLALNLTVYSSKKIEIRDSPGFKVTLSKDLKNTMIEYENINHYNYLSHIDVYTTYLYNNFLNSKKEKVKELLSKKFGGPKELIINEVINEDPVNKAEQKEAEKEADDDDDDGGAQHDDDHEYDEDTDEEGDSSDDDGYGTGLESDDEEEQEGGSDSESSDSESSDSESDEEEENIYGNLENVRVTGANNYFINKIKEKEPYLYAKRTGKMFSFATSCPANYRRTPVLITSGEKEKIDKLDEKSSSRSYDEFITTENDNHYICPRFWCLSDKTAPNGRSLSFKQVNDGVCGGWDAIIGENEKPSNEKRIFEFTDEKYHDQIKGNNFAYRPHYPGWSRKKVGKIKGKGEENICIPCCYNMPRTEYEPKKDWEEEDEKAKKGLKYWETSPQAYQKVGEEKPGDGAELSYDEDRGISFYDNLAIAGIDKKFRRGRKTPQKNNMRAKEFDFCDGNKESKGEITDKTIEFMSIPIIETFPLKYSGQLGYLPLNVQRLFNYNIVERVFKKKIKVNGKDKIIKNSKLPSEKWVFVRLGMMKNDILTNISNVHKYYLRTKRTKKNDLEHEEIASITSRLMVSGDVNRGKVRLFQWLKFYKKNEDGRINYFDREITTKKLPTPKEFDEYRNRIKNNKRVKDNFVSMNKGNLYQMFKSKKDKGVEYAIINFIKFIWYDGARDTKAHEIFWDIITTPISEGGAFFDEGINLIILKRPKEDIVDKIDIVCPNNNFFKTAYRKDRPTVILYTENNMYEPIYMIKKPKARTDKGWLMVKMFLKEHFELRENSSKLSRFKEVIEKVIENIDQKCKITKGIKTEKGYIFEENKTLNKWLDVDDKGEYKKQKNKYTIEGKEVIGQLHNEDYQSIAIIVKMESGHRFLLPCAPSSIFPHIKKYRYGDKVTKLKNLLNYESTEIFIDGFGLTLEEESKRDVIATYGDRSMIIGIRTNTNQIIPIIPTDIKYPEKDFVNKLIEWDIDKKILEKYPHQDKERLEIMKKIKLESNFYSMYRNLFKILINNADQKKNKKKIIGILNNVTKSYWEKIKVILEEIKLMDDIIEWTNIDMNVFPDDLINCLGLDDDNCKGPSCIKNENTCKFIIPEYNLLYEENDERKTNKELYKLRLADEIIRYEKIREYVLKNDVFLNFDSVEYKINDDEIVIISKMFFKIYMNNIDQVYKSDNITNYKIYDNVNVKKYGKKRLTLTFEEGESGYDTNSEVEESEDESNSVVEEKAEEEKPKAKKTKAKKAKAPTGIKIAAGTRKFIAYLMWYEYLKTLLDEDGNNINKWSIDKFKKIPIVQKWIKIGEEEVEIINKKGNKEKITKLKRESSLNSINKFGLLDDWGKSIFKDYKLYGDDKMPTWEKDFKEKKSGPKFHWNMNTYYINGPDKFLRHMKSKGGPLETIDELLENFKDKVIYTVKGAQELDKLNDEQFR